MEDAARIAHPSRRDLRHQGRLTVFGLGTAACALLLGAAALLIGSKEHEETLAKAEPTIDAAYLAYNEPHPDLDKILKEKQEQADLIVLLQKQLDKSSQDVREMEERLKLSETKNTAIQAPKISHEQQALQKELALAKNQIDKLQQFVGSLKAELSARHPGMEALANYKEQNRQLSNSLADLQNKNRELTNCLSTLQIQNQRLALTLETQQKKHEELAAVEQRYHNAVSEGHAANKRAHEQELLIRELADSLQQQKRLIAKLENSRNNLKINLEATSQEHDETVTRDNRPLPQQIPQETPDKNNQQLHTVSKGETLSGISARYYGTSKRWATIYEANKSLITDANNLKVGTTLVIP